MIGGYDIQKQEIREAVELPLTHFDLYKQIGIDPPRGVLLYGPPGTGSSQAVSLLARSSGLAGSLDSCFLVLHSVISFSHLQ